MSYSRRQLYAMGETFGDSATRMEAGGRIIYGGGGGGDAPKTVEPTTRVTEYGPDMTSFNRSSTNEIPRYLTNASQDLVARGSALSSRPYEAYTGNRVADFTPDMEAAFERMRNQQVAPQIGEATGLASLAGKRAMDYGMFGEGVQQYMNPYMQNVVDIERRKAQEAADQQSAILSGQATRQGAFGGSGAALQQRALRRDTAQQLGDIQAQGLNRAYEGAVNQYNQGISSGLAAAGQLGGLGQMQFGQEMDITKGLGMAGDVQRQREQALLDVAYGDYLTEQRYPYEQLAFQQSLVSGVPYSTTQRSAGQDITQKGKTVEQTMTTTEKAPENPPVLTRPAVLPNEPNNAKGGEIRSYADGGITSLLSDQQIAQRQQMPNISDLARMSMQAEAMERAQLRAAQQAMMAQQQPQGTVADEELARIATLEQGIGGLDVPDNLVGDASMAGGGIVAFYEGKEVPAMDDEIARRAKVKQRNGMALTEEEILALQNANSVEPPIAPELGGIAGMAREMAKFRPAGPQLGGITDQPPIEIESKPEDRPSKRGTSSSSSILDQIYGGQEQLVREASAKEMAAQQAYKDDLAKESKESGDFAAKARQRIEQQIAALEGEDKSAAESSILDFGLRLLSAKGEKNMAKAIAGAGLNTLAGHKQALKDIAAKRDKYENALRQVDEFEYGEKKGTRKEERAAILALGKADAALSNSLGDLLGARGKDVLQLYRDRQSRAHAENMASKRATSSGLGLDRLELAKLRERRLTLVGLAKRATDDGEPEKAAEYTRQLESIQDILEGVGPAGSGKVQGSSTLPAGFKLD